MVTRKFWEPAELVLVSCPPGFCVQGSVVYCKKLPSEDYMLGIRLDAPVEERSEEHTSELQSHSDLVCRLLLEKKKKKKIITTRISLNRILTNKTRQPRHYDVYNSYDLAVDSVDSCDVARDRHMSVDSAVSCHN